MRFFEIASGLRVPVSQEEQELLDFITAQERVAASKLTERQRELARLMTSRGLLIRLLDEKVIAYSANGLPDLWRM